MNREELIKQRNRLNDEINKLIEDEKKKKELPPPPKFKDSNIFKLKSKRKRFYIIPIINIIIAIFLFIVVYRLYNLVWLFFYLFLAIPIVLLSGGFLFVRLYLDNKHIKSELVKALSNNYVIAKFFKEGKRSEEYAIRLNHDNMSLNYEKGLYIVDSEAIYYNQDKRPCLDYDLGLPNPRIYDNSNVKISVSKQLATTGNPVLRDFKGRKVDITYSSTNLDMFKKDKIIHDVHSNPAMEKMMYVFAGLLGLSFIVIVIIILVKQ